MTKDELLSKLIDEWMLPPQTAEIMLAELEQAPAPIKEAYEQWLLDESIAEIEREGISAQMLIERCGMNPPGAFHTLCWLEADPKDALRTLKKAFYGLL